jgi:hypothetical protein
MNAYELAEKLYLSFQDTYHEDAANMLRQQADTIEELKQQIWSLQNTLTNRTLRTYDGKLE